jgi:hypothetical protein
VLKQSISRYITPWLAALLLSSCATMPPSGGCEHFESVRQSLRYDTHYRYSETDTRNAARAFKTKPNSEVPAARWYTLRVNRAQSAACDHLYLMKELYLHGADGSVTLEEHREIYGANDRLIATKREDVTSQLKAAGFYSAATPLPIPPETPGGAYRVVSRLVAKSAGKERTLATASVEFRVHR